MTQDKDAPLREDIRLLGRLLGDTVRDQQGAAAFELIEHIRQNSVRFRRDDDVAARRELEDVLDALSRDQTIQVVRAFSYFSHLANIAEDQHHIRRSRAHLIAGSAPREGSLAHALARAFASGLGADALVVFFAEALVSPVLTAHPTEVQRKSILNCETVIARLLDERDRMQLTPEEAEANLEALRRAVLTLWQTRMLRYTRLTVADERQMPVEEILRRLQAFEDAQERAIDNYTATNTTHLRFGAGPILMVHKVATQLIASITHTVRKPRRSRVEQNKSAAQGRRIQENDLGKVVRLLQCPGI